MNHTLITRMTETSQALEASGPKNASSLQNQLGFQPGQALKMLNIIRCVTSVHGGRGGRVWHSRHPFDPSTPKEPPATEEEQANRLQYAADLRLIADWLDTTCKEHVE